MKYEIIFQSVYFVHCQLPGTYELQSFANFFTSFSPVMEYNNKYHSILLICRLFLICLTYSRALKMKDIFYFEALVNTAS
jgi:hypothetical protein